jgi:DNA-binding response OmpR family regulator
MKINLLSKNIWLEDILLKQYIFDLEFTEKDADILISDNKDILNICLAKTAQTWEIEKPVSIAEIINIIEHAKQILFENVIIIGPISFHPNQRICYLQSEEIILTQKETEILLCLADHEEGVGKEALLEAVWGYSGEISTRTLETHIYKLRSKFTDKYDIIQSDPVSGVYFLLMES